MQAEEHAGPKSGASKEAVPPPATSRDYDGARIPPRQHPLVRRRRLAPTARRPFSRRGRRPPPEATARRTAQRTGLVLARPRAHHARALRFDAPVARMNAPKRAVHAPMPALHARTLELRAPIPRIGTPMPGIGMPMRDIGEPMRTIGAPMPSVGACTSNLLLPMKNGGASMKFIGAPTRIIGTPMNFIRAPMFLIGAAESEGRARVSESPGCARRAANTTKGSVRSRKTRAIPTPSPVTMAFNRRHREK